MPLTLLVHDLHLELQDFNLGNLNSAVHQGQLGSLKNTPIFSLHAPPSPPLNQNQQLFKVPSGFQCAVVRVSVLISVPPINRDF